MIVITSREFWRFCLSVAAIVFAIYIIKSLPTDDSDKGFWHRSNMEILTDHRTGLEYLSNGYGITPRIGADGRQISDGSHP